MEFKCTECNTVLPFGDYVDSGASICGRQINIWYCLEAICPTCNTRFSILDQCKITYTFENGYQLKERFFDDLEKY